MNAQEKTMEEIISTDRLIAMELRRAIARFSDSQAEAAEQLLKEVDDTGLTDTQINGLLSVVNTSPTVTSIIRFVERQGARPGRVGEAWQRNGLAEKLLREVRSSLATATTLAQKVQRNLIEHHRRQDTETEVKALTEKQGRLPEVHYLLVREFIQSFAIGYLYRYVRRRGQGEKEEKQQ